MVIKKRTLRGLFKLIHVAPKGYGGRGGKRATETGEKEQGTYD